MRLTHFLSVHRSSASRMLGPAHIRLVPLVGLLIFIFFTIFALKLSNNTFPKLATSRGPSPSIDESGTTVKINEGEKVLPPGPHYVKEAYNEISSVSTADKKYFRIKFGGLDAINPNAISHPSLENTWIIVAQKQRSNVKDSVFFSELVCNAVFKKDALVCMDSPLILPIGITPVSEEKCTGDLAYYGWSVGPHDARVFYGPSLPYAIYGSTALHTCMGQWILDFRVLVDWGFEFYDKDLFRVPTELQRPPPYNFMEKNYFLFWDKDERMYIHHDISPKRVFAQLSYNGTIGPDLAPQASSDTDCMAKHMPALTPPRETLHQATNSLSITTCRRSDPACKPNDANTFIMTIFQHKKSFGEHILYEPYVMLFRQEAPFAIHGITSKPLWINGRGKQGEWKNEAKKTVDQTQFLYITSMSWKSHGQKYHGYIDDVLFLLFGIEDADTAGIDVTAGDILRGLDLCSS